MSRHVYFRFLNASCALVNGHGTREMLTEMMGRPPVWATVSRGWVVQPRRARDLVANLEHRGGYDVTVTNVDADQLSLEAAP